MKNNKYEQSVKMLKELKELSPTVTLSELRTKYASTFGIVDVVALTRGIKSLSSLELIRSNSDGSFDILVE